ncbi:hypothetical protein CEXT_91291 [Caerostris extrusa]|uniref:Uncharacterized protein n=1 Tax=Caerostris extrusa TaxID=172846 RepID=A0AAV4Y064_CAEEX|nr:hypothetical protein CEXT_91291 [Caerostris extrusa]
MCFRSRALYLWMSTRKQPDCFGDLCCIFHGASNSLKEKNTSRFLCTVRKICASGDASLFVDVDSKTARLFQGIYAVYFMAPPTPWRYVTEIQICDSIIERHFCGLRRLRK